MQRGALCMRTVRELSPSSISNILPNLASQMRVAFSSIAWNTGSSSPGDELMTRSTSDVAVCCSSDLPQFIEQPRVLDGDDGLGGEACNKINLLVGEWPYLLALNRKGAD